MEYIIRFLPLEIFAGLLIGLGWWLRRRLVFSFSSEGRAQRGVRPWAVRIALVIGAVYLGLIVLEVIVAVSLVLAASL